MGRKEGKNDRKVMRENFAFDLDSIIIFFDFAAGSGRLRIHSFKVQVSRNRNGFRQPTVRSVSSSVRGGAKTILLDSGELIFLSDL